MCQEPDLVMSVEQFEGTVVSGCVELVTVELPAVSQQGLAEEIRLLQHHRLRGVSTVVSVGGGRFRLVLTLR